MANRSEIRYVPIDADLRRRFDDCAPGALSRRTPARLQTQALSMLQWLVVGGIGLIGVFVWHWSAMTLLLVWLAGIAAGIAGDLAKWLIARQRLIRQMERFSDDQFVWAMVMALQKSESRIREETLHRHRPGFGCCSTWSTIATNWSAVSILCSGSCPSIRSQRRTRRAGWARTRSTVG